MAADAQLEMAQEAGVVVKKTDVGRARRMDVARNGGGAESLAVDQGEVVDLARLQRLKASRGSTCGDGISISCS